MKAQKQFQPNDSVVVKRLDGSTASGKVVRQVEDGKYLVYYIFNGYVVSGEFNTALSRITENPSFGDASGIMVVATNPTGTVHTVPLIYGVMNKC